MSQEAAPAGSVSGERLNAHRARQAAPALTVAVGLLLLAGGALLDIGHHTGLPGFAAEWMGATGHLVTLAGMLLIAGAVALVATLRRR